MPAPYLAQLVPTWLGFAGGTQSQPLILQDQTQATLVAETPLLTAMQALSCCGLQAACHQSFKPYSTAPVAGVYGSVLDVASFLFKTANGRSVRIDVPGPIAGLFLADGRSVDLTRADVLAFKAQVLAVVADSAEEPVVELVSAARSRYKRS